MVFISRQAKVDLDNIFIGMLHRNKMELSVEFAEKYIDALVEQCYFLEKNFYHTNTVYPEHKKYGNKVHKYRRNAHWPHPRGNPENPNPVNNVFARSCIWLCISTNIFVLAPNSLSSYFA